MALIMAAMQMLLLFISIYILGVLQIANSHETTSRSFIILNDTFYKDGEPFRILGGEIHYFRIVPKYWKDRILRAKALGLNTVQTYIPWNIHEPTQGSFVFDGFGDLEGFLKLAQELDVLVMLRLGPYVCGEWDFGGFPYWLLSKQPPLKLRTSDTQYLKYVDNWWNVLLPKLVPLLYPQGGPVIMLQIENEYGSYGRDKDYLHHLAVHAREHLGKEVILYTTDGATTEALENGTITQDNVYAAIDYPTGWDPVSAFELQKNYNAPGKSPPLSAEFYTGWLTHWGEGLARTDANTTATELHKLLNANGSVVLYMAHGGTNFGFYNGANTGNKETIYQPDITSYDYDAPIGEGGELGEKYYALREVFAKYTSSPLPDPPSIPERISPESVILQKIVSVFGVLDTLSYGVKVENPVSMETLNQSYGFILYRTTLPAYAKAGYKLTISKVHDRAHIYIGETIQTLKLIGIIERWSNSSLKLPSGSYAGLELFILVENMGRVNYGPYLYDPKGLLSSVLLGNIPITSWTVYSLSLQNVWGIFEGTQSINLAQKPDSDYNISGPALYSGVFEVDTPADTFISFNGWSKGVAFVNGFNLGRFWPAAGPQCTLYVPGPLLKANENKLLIMELENSTNANKTIYFSTEHDWTCTRSTVLLKQG